MGVAPSMANFFRNKQDAMIIKLVSHPQTGALHG